MSKSYVMVNGAEYELEQRPNAEDDARRALMSSEGQGLLQAVIRGRPVTVIVNRSRLTSWAVYSTDDGV